MTLKPLIKLGIPLSFVYCTIYQQDIWREGDDRLIAEQKRVWSNFFSTIDNVYYKLTGADTKNLQERKGIVPRFSVDCWNSKVQGTFAAIDRAVSKPSYIACKLYRKVTPYFSSEPVKSPHDDKINTSNQQIQ